jgi:hypothetical protein
VPTSITYDQEALDLSAYSKGNTVREDTKVERTEPGAALSEQDLNKVAGGTGGTKEVVIELVGRPDTGKGEWFWVLYFECYISRRNTMTEDTKKVENTEPQALAAELSEQDLEKVAGGVFTVNPSVAHELTIQPVPTGSQIVVSKTQDQSSPTIYNEAAGG